MIDIFLSASIPLPNRNRHYFETADVLAIREAIKALVEIVLPVGTITFGGHPAISPLLDFFAKEANLDPERVTIFQSQFFLNLYPQQNAKLQNFRFIEAVNNDREQSLYAMRKAMIESRPFKAAVFIGGMEGVIAEAELFSQLRPYTKMIPVASTGAAASDIFYKSRYPTVFAEDLTYTTLFRRHLLRD